MNNEIGIRTGFGAAAGLAGTLVIQGLLAASQKWVPQSLPPIKQDPGEFMIEKAEEHLPEKVREKIPEQLEKPGRSLWRWAMDSPSARCMPRPGRRQETCSWKGAPWV